MNKRTCIDFSKHEVIVKKSEDCLVYYLKKPDTVIESIKFINTNGILAVTGDFGNWIFCREFHPSKNGSVSDSYWVEKLKIASCQNPYEFDSDIAKKEISEMLEEDDESLSKEEKEWLNELYNEADQGEYAFIAKAMDHPSSFDTEYIPRRKRLNFWLEAVFDGFEEICSREKEQCDV